jgi:hypothetical protein
VASSRLLDASATLAALTASRSDVGRVQAQQRGHVPDAVFDELFREVCNETPATRELLSLSVRDLCVAGELEKGGGTGERRAPTTLPHGDDLVRVARQGRLVFTP